MKSNPYSVYAVSIGLSGMYLYEFWESLAGPKSWRTNDHILKVERTKASHVGSYPFMLQLGVF